MPARLTPLVDAAITRWQEIEASLLAGLGMSREQFLGEFERARASFQAGGHDWSDLVRFGPLVYGAVRNLDVVNLFAWVLPTADSDRRGEHQVRGRMVVAVFYLA